MLINRDLEIYILKWLYKRKNNTLISKSMLPKLNDFKSFSDIDVWQSLNALNGQNLVSIKKLYDGKRPLELISISEQGECFLQFNQMTAHEDNSIML